MGVCSRKELAGVLALRDRIHRVWDAPDGDAAAALVNRVLEEADSLPQLTRHDGWDWHMHFGRRGATLSARLGAELAMGLADLIRHDDLERLRYCSAPDCSAVLVDLSRNRSRLYCDTGNCGNKQHVAAYRARRASRRPS